MHSFKVIRNLKNGLKTNNGYFVQNGKMALNGAAATAAMSATTEKLNYPAPVQYR